MGFFRKLFGKSEEQGIHKAIRLYRSDNYARALEETECLIAQRRDVPLTWYLKGKCLFRLFRLEEALAAFDKAGQLCQSAPADAPGNAQPDDSGMGDLILWVAQCHLKSGRNAQARRILDDFIANAAPNQEDLVEVAGRLLAKVP